VSNEDVRQPDGEKLHRVVRNSGDSEVENLFSNRKWVSANEIPALSLKESLDADSVSVFKSKADFDNLGLSTHRPESTTRSSVTDFTDDAYQVSYGTNFTVATASEVQRFLDKPVTFHSLDENDFIRDRAQELLRIFSSDETDSRVEAES